MKVIVSRKPNVTETTYGETVSSEVDYLEASKIEEDVLSEGSTVKIYKIYVPTKPNPEIPLQYGQNDYIISILGG